MGQSNARQRLAVMKENINEINAKIRTKQLTEAERRKTHDVLIQYIKELKFILGKSLRASKISKVEKCVILAMEELAILEGESNKFEPHIKAKSLRNLTQIEDSIKSIGDSITNQRLDTEREALNTFKTQITTIEEVDQEVEARVSEVLNVASNVEHAFTELELEAQLRLLEDKHYHSRVDLEQFHGSPRTDSYNDHKQFLQQLKSEVAQIEELNAKITQRKNYLSYNIDNNLIALHQRAKRNEERVTLRCFSGTNNSTHSLIYDVVNSYIDFEHTFSPNCSVRDLQEVFSQLGQLKTRIEQKLELMRNTIRIRDVDPYVQLVPVKESKARIEHEPSVRSEETNIQQAPVEEPRQNKDIEDEKHTISDAGTIKPVAVTSDCLKQSRVVEETGLVESNPVRLVTIKEDFVQLSPTFIKSTIDEIQSAVQQIDQQISASSRDPQIYKDLRNKLKGFKTELCQMDLGNHDNRKLAYAVLKKIDDVLVVLDGNLVERRVTTGDLLIDIMSIGTSVSNLNARIESNCADKEYEAIENELLDNLYFLKKLEVPFSRTNICKYRDFVLLQIDGYLSKLERFRSKGHRPESDIQLRSAPRFVKRSASLNQPSAANWACFDN